MGMEVNQAQQVARDAAQHNTQAAEGAKQAFIGFGKSVSEGINGIAKAKTEAAHRNEGESAVPPRPAGVSATAASTPTVPNPAAASRISPS